MKFLTLLKNATIVTSLTYRLMVTSALIVHLVRSARKK